MPELVFPASCGLTPGSFTLERKVGFSFWYQIWVVLSKNLVGLWRSFVILEFSESESLGFCGLLREMGACCSNRIKAESPVHTGSFPYLFVHLMFIWSLMVKFNFPIIFYLQSLAGFHFDLAFFFGLFRYNMIIFPVWSFMTALVSLSTIFWNRTFIGSFDYLQDSIPLVDIIAFLYQFRHFFSVLL